MRYLKADTLEALRDSIEDNLERYRDGTFADLFKDLDDSTRLLPGDFDVSRLSELRSPIPDELFDAENSKLVYDALSALTPLQAREERIWVFLTHTSCLDYTRARWPIPASTEKAVKHVKAHFFAPSLRAVERDNSISRLWWMGMIAGRATGLSADEALEVLMFRTDVRANLIERPTTSSSVSVFSAVLRKLKESYNGKRELHKRMVNRAFMKEINSVGGVKLLDSLDAGALDDLMDEIVTQRLKISEV